MLESAQQQVFDVFLKAQAISLELFSRGPSAGTFWPESRHFRIKLKTCWQIREKQMLRKAVNSEKCCLIQQYDYVFFPLKAKAMGILPLKWEKPRCTGIVNSP
ncbi:MAG: hypothetical protein K2X27_26715 [Candidatus Obscuribacterales bacterium]|nr:hypothetical protein [Candidatus Obscuribacterales bacterium]